MAYNGPIPTTDSMMKPLPSFNNGHWTFPEQMGEGNVGFIYVIRDVYLQRCYLGKKQFYGTGKLNAGKESDWRKYKSSSKLLKELFRERPVEEFEFICIEQYKTKGTLSYAETWSLCLVEAPTCKEWYNTLIGKVSWSVREPVSERHKERLRKILEWEEIED